MALTDKLTAIGDAIRTKTGGTDPIALADMPAQIEGISGGGFPNGTEWKRSNIAATMSVVYHANGIWVAGGMLDGLYYSTDGMNWTHSNITSGKVNDVYGADGVWVACIASGDNNGVYYSTDGKTWEQYSTINIYAYKMVRKYENVWFLGRDGVGSYYSTNGKDWVLVDSCGNLCCYGNGVWVSVASNASLGIMYSTDGIAWNTSNIQSGNPASPIRPCFYGDGLFVCAASGIYYSTDGMNWTMSNVTSSWISSIYYANGVWVADASNSLYYSTDGMNWTRSAVSIGAINSVYNANGVWVAATSTGLSYSTDGINWTKSNIQSGTYRSVYNANGVWVAASASGLYYSPTWLPS